MELLADNKMEAPEKLRSISDSLKVLQDGRAGHVPSVKHFMCKQNFMSFNFAVQPQPRKPQKFVDLENFSFYGMLLRYLKHWMDITCRYRAKFRGNANKGEEHCSYE